MHVKSAVDKWFRLIVYIVIGIMLASAILLTATTSFRLYQIVIAYAAVALASGILLWLLFGTYYELREDHLYCRSGPFCEKIPYDEISQLSFTENMLSSMALSSQRIEIHRQGRGYILGTTLISPENLEIFMAQLKMRCTHLDAA